ncbi:hypothetical protein D9611_003656 [Ephemerocybe angulata]|uniref:F-box domain-containing protein n=1 Tax=Ephemerocybe angulata TaxID=980116 RepID=A0A8H5EYE7_9AGAR|nr:hypothetical protein D9611_003656 [Tulosesus angulatus]
MSRFTHEKPKLTEDGERIYKDQEERMDHLKAGKARLLEEIESAMADLVQERRELLPYSASPISVVPNEILSTLFHELQRTTRATGKPMVPHAEIILSHVCSHWRAVVLSLPSMWCVFHRDGRLVFNDRALELDRQTEARLAAYLDRSREHPFDFWVKLEPTRQHFRHGAQHLKLTTQLLSVILPHLHRFRVFHLLLGVQQVPGEFWKMLAMASVPLLEICAICPDLAQPNTTRYSAETELDTFQGGALSLKYLRLDETSLFVIRPPLQTVVDLRIERRLEEGPAWIPNGVLAEIFALPNLQTLSLFGDIFSFQAAGGGAIPNRPIHAQNLKHIRSTGTYITVFLYSHVLAPSLESITLSGLEEDEISASSLARIPAHAVFPSLRVVAITAAWIGFPNDLRALQIIMSQNVEELSFLGGTAYTRPKEVFRTLVGANGMPSSQQKIKKATLSMRAFSDSEEIGYYHQFIQARPNLEILRVPSACLQPLTDFMDGLPSSIKIQAIDESEPLLPLCWLPGPEWLDTEEDPFLADCYVWGF